jgi:hypothetical protein
VTDEQVRAALGHLERLAFLSERDGCRVARAVCSRCKCTFEEELQAAKDRVIKKLDFFCLACDPDASVPAFTGITIQIGWYS